VALADRVLVPNKRLDPQERPDSSKQLLLAERLCDEVVRTGLDRLRLLPGLAVTMITGSTAVSTRSRSRRQTV
jgi:hypothetical protein